MARTSAVIRALLVDAGVVKMPYEQETPGWTPPPGLPEEDPPVCFVGNLPDDYDRLVFVKDGPAPVGGREATGRYRTKPGFTVVVRESDDDRGDSLANAVAVALASVKMGTVTLPEDDAQVPHYVQAVHRTTAVTFVGREKDKDRLVWTFNGRLSYQDAEPSCG